MICWQGTCARIGVPRGEAVMAQGDVCHGGEASMFIVVEGLLTAWIESTPGGMEIDVVSDECQNI